MAVKQLNTLHFPSDSENYIFGKFDTFCKRLEKIKDMANTVEQFSGLPKIKIEGIDALIVRHKSIMDTIKKRSYDILDHRKGEVSARSFFYTRDEKFSRMSHVVKQR